MAEEIHPNDIGLAAFEDVGDVSKLRTNDKHLVGACNELYEMQFSAPQDQLFLEGENNRILGKNNVVKGDNNVVIGEGNIVNGNNQVVIGNRRTVCRSLDNITIESFNITSKAVYYYYNEADAAQKVFIGDLVAFDMNFVWYNEGWYDSVSVYTGLIFARVVDVSDNYIYFEKVPEMSQTPPDDVYINLDMIYVDRFVVLRDEFFFGNAGGVTLGNAASGQSSFTANYGSAPSSYSAALNYAHAQAIGAFAVNSSTCEGNYGIAGNRAVVYKNYGAAFNGGWAGGSYSTALNYGRCAGRPLKCSSINPTGKYFVAATGENISDLKPGMRLMVRYRITSSLYITTVKITSISGSNIYHDTSFSTSVALMPDGCIFRFEDAYATNFANGYYTIASHSYSTASGKYTAAIHPGAVIMGQYGTSPEDYSWALANGTSTTNVGLAAKILQNGNIAADGSLSSPCADYAELFEWQDGNPDHEDRTGHFVKLVDGDKIAYTEDFEEAFGVVSATPAIVGDSGEMRWQGKFATDDFGRTLMQEVTIPPVLDGKGNVLEEGRTERQPVLNPDFDSEQEYTPRMERPEWSPVGVLGKLIVYDDGSLHPGDLCRTAADGKAAKSIKGGFKVLKRAAADKVLIWFKQ